VDDVLLVTGETVTQIQDRVLGVGINGAPLFREVKGFATAGSGAVFDLAVMN
jgi:hypothetical protein